MQSLTDIQSNFENQQQIRLTVESVPIRRPIQWIQKSHNAQNCLYMLNIALVFIWPKKILKIVGGWLWRSIRSDSTADSVEPKSYNVQNVGNIAFSVHLTENVLKIVGELL